MDHLRLIDPLENVERYDKRGFISRNKIFTDESLKDWTCFFGDADLGIRWVVPWWRIGSIVGIFDDSPYVRLSSLYTMTFIFFEGIEAVWVPSNNS